MIIRIHWRGTSFPAPAAPPSQPTEDGARALVSEAQRRCEGADVGSRASALSVSEGESDGLYDATAVRSGEMKTCRARRGS